MSKWFKQYVSIAKNSFFVIMGDPLTLIMQIIIILAILVIASLPGFTLGGQLKLVRDQVLALSFICGCLLAAVGASRVIGEDLRKGMIPTILSRPVSASALLAGKWSGLTLSLAAFFFLAAVSSLWGSRLIYREHTVEELGIIVYLGTVLLVLAGVAIHHYKRGGNYNWQGNIVLLILFPVAFGILNIWGYNGASAGYGSMVDWDTAFAFIYLFMALLTFSSIITFFSVVMDISMLMSFAVIVFFWGLFSEYLGQLVTAIPFIRAMMAIIIPDWQMYWVSETLTSVSFFGEFFWSHLVHAVFQSVLFVVLAGALFERKEVTGTI